MRIISLMYHDTYGVDGPHTPGFKGVGADRYKLAAHDFRDPLLALQSGGGSAISVLAAITDQQSGSFLLTFDDGGVSALTETAPLLDELGWPVIFSSPPAVSVKL
ncbi:hypothetical protein H8D51_04380, partial [bacterium]|nr:hypothetical protein [bacterium]